MPLADDEGDLHANFDFGATKGFLGPSGNPASQDPFVNADGTIIAVNHQPQTKSSNVHLWLRLARGDLMFLNDVNGRIARLLKGRFAESAKYFLRVELIAGRKILLQTVDFAGDYGTPDRAPRYSFAVLVKSTGEFALTK